MKNPRKIELLSPAKNAEVGKEAILHGADAVYIGAPRFGARSAAANSVGDIAALCEMAHKYDARVYVALNTLLKEDELMEAGETDSGTLLCGCRCPYRTGYGNYPS